MGRYRVFPALDFAKFFQVSFLHPATPYAFAVFLEFVLTRFESKFTNFLPRFFSDCFCSFVGGCLHHILCSAFESFANAHKSVTDQARPLVFISIPSGVFVKHFCPLTWVIHGVYKRQQKYLLFFNHYADSNVNSVEIQGIASSVCHPSPY